MSHFVDKKLEETDKKIIAAMAEDGRITNKQLAKMLAVSEGTIRNRISKLLDANLLRIAGLINPDEYADRQLLLLGVKVSVSRDLSRIAQAISELPDVLSVSITSGQYDMFVEIWTHSKYGLIDFIDGQLATIDGIVSTESFMVMKSYKKWIPINNRDNFSSPGRI
jgi:Lrp/AsnC family transcriptional regulator for asnA, asnC and gidA